MADPPVEHDDLSVLERAWRGTGETGPPHAIARAEARLTVSRQEPDDVQDRQIFLFVDGRPWGKIRYGQSVTREITPGRHQVRAFNTLYSRTLDVDVRPAGHTRLRCANGFPKSGYLMFMFFHVTFLRVRLEPDSSGS